ncbi:hypothetical protein Tco_0509662 [Tanacetum coccineum]
MKISSLMNAHKCPELAKQYSNKVLKTLDEMMVRLDDFVRSEEAFAITELLKGELSEPSKKASCPINIRDDRLPSSLPLTERRPLEERSSPTEPEFTHQAPQGDLASELHLNLPQPRSMQLPLGVKNQDKYCDYHGEEFRR